MPAQRRDTAAPPRTTTIITALPCTRTALQLAVHSHQTLNQPTNQPPHSTLSTLTPPLKDPQGLDRPQLRPGQGQVRSY